jgi:hypothetical protein
MMVLLPGETLLLIESEGKAHRAAVVVGWIYSEAQSAACGASHRRIRPVTLRVNSVLRFIQNQSPDRSPLVIDPSGR